MYHPSPSIYHNMLKRRPLKKRIFNKNKAVSQFLSTLMLQLATSLVLEQNLLTLKCVSDPDLDIVQAAAEEATEGRTFPVKRK